MKKLKSRSNNPKGRPSNGLTETKILVGMPKALRAAVNEAADAAKEDIAAWIRGAIRRRLGLADPTDPKQR